MASVLTPARSHGDPTAERALRHESDAGLGGLSLTELDQALDNGEVDLTQHNEELQRRITAISASLGKKAA